MATTTDKKPIYECPYCMSTNFPSEPEFLEHLEKCPARTLKCPYCDKQYKSKDWLDKHIPTCPDNRVRKSETIKKALDMQYKDEEELQNLEAELAIKKLSAKKSGEKAKKTIDDEKNVLRANGIVREEECGPFVMVQVTKLWHMVKAMAYYDAKGHVLISQIPGYVTPGHRILVYRKTAE